MIETYKDVMGELVHMEDGELIGVSRPGLIGRVDHYDAAGNFTGFSEPGIAANAVHYDRTGARVGESVGLPFGVLTSTDEGSFLTTETLDGFVTDDLF